MLVGISSPYRRTGLLHQKFKDHYGTSDDDVLVVRGGTAMFNPTIAKATIAKEMKADPEVGSKRVASRVQDRHIRLVRRHGNRERRRSCAPARTAPRSGHRYFAFADASAGRHDAFTFCIGHVEGKPPESLTWTGDVVRGRPAPFDPRTTAYEFAQLARAYGCKKVVGDAYAGAWVEAAFKDAGIKYETSPIPKSQLYLEALPHFNRGAINIPVPILLRELRCLERRVHRSGRDSVDHPSHGSDDYANVACGALNVATRETRKPGMSIGYGAPGYGPGMGKIIWDDAEFERPRPRVVRVDEHGRVLTSEEAAAIVRRGLL